MKLIERRSFLAAGAVALGVISRQAWSAPASRVWTFDNLQKIGGRSVKLEGEPTLVGSPWGPAVAFDGKDCAVHR